ncbi:inositol monophosphatase family protein [Thermotoga profunda]|uniref:inositol monophosphatase family protein n=1 Tax=Thermotoga profunda TaxID=1508420 RepID=UPI0005971750|nr:inositol monophosphatase family protein [Thermotoga profunda]
MKLICEAAKKAGIFAKEKFEKEHVINVKTRVSDVVTEVDVTCQKIIVDTILEHLPEARFVLEEGDGGTKIPNAECIFVVDPIDGTLNYVHSLPYFAVSIARIDYGEITEAAVYLPMTDEMFYAKKGSGAFLNGTQIVNKNRSSLEKSFLVTGWPYDESLFDWTLKSIERLTKITQEIRILGSSAAELCYLACGKLDGYWEVGLKPWDTAGGVLIAREAGVIVTGLEKDYDLESGEIVAAIPSIHEKLRKILREIK